MAEVVTQVVEEGADQPRVDRVPRHAVDAVILVQVNVQRRRRAAEHQTEPITQSTTTRAPTGLLPSFLDSRTTHYLTSMKMPAANDGRGSLSGGLWPRFLYKKKRSTITKVKNHGTTCRGRSIPSFNSVLATVSIVKVAFQHRPSRIDSILPGYGCKTQGPLK